MSNGNVHSTTTVTKPDGSVHTEHFVNGKPVKGSSSTLDSRFGENSAPANIGGGFSGGSTSSFVSSGGNGHVTSTNTFTKPDGSVVTQQHSSGKLANHFGFQYNLIIILL